MIPVPVVQLGSVLALLSALSSARAQVEGFDFEPDTLTKGDLAVWAIWTVLYLILLVLCFIALAIRRGHRLIYAILFPTVFLTVIQCLANIVYIVLDNNDLTFEGPPGGAGPITAMSGLSVFAGNISFALFFLAIALLFVDRYKAVNQAASVPGKLNILFSVFAYVYSGFLLVLGLASAGLATSAESAFWNYYELAIVDENALEIFIDEAFQDYTTKLNQANSMSYAYSAFSDLTIFFLIGISIFVLTNSKRLRVSDMVSRSATFLTIPLYTIFVLLTFLVFLIVFSPSGIKTFISFEESRLAADVLTNLFYLAILSIVIIGLMRSMWNIKVQQEGQYTNEMNQAYPQGDQYHKPSFTPQPYAIPTQQYEDRRHTVTPPSQDPIPA